MSTLLSLPVRYCVAAILWATSIFWTILSSASIDFQLHLYCTVCTTVAFLSLNVMIGLNLESLGLRPKKNLKSTISDFQKQLAIHRTSKPGISPIDAVSQVVRPKRHTAV